MKIFKIISSGVAIGIVGVVLFSSKAVLVKLAYQYQVSSIHFLLFRMLFSLPFYLVIAFIYKPTRPELIQKNDYLWIVFFGFIGYYLASYFDFIGLQFIKAGLERVILFIYPTLVLIISRIFFKTRVSSKQQLAILITYIGIVITFWSEIVNTSNSAENNQIIIGGSFIFISALTYASYLVGSGWLIPKFGVVVFTSYAMIVSSICVILHYAIIDRQTIFQYPTEVYILGVLMAVFSTLIPSFLVSLSIKKIGASNFSILGSIGPISTIVLAFFILNERLTLVQFIGIIIVILGITIVSKNKSKSKSRP